MTCVNMATLLVENHHIWVKSSWFSIDYFRMKSNLIFKKSPDVGYRHLSSATSATVPYLFISWTPTFVCLAASFRYAML